MSVEVEPASGPEDVVAWLDALEQRRGGVVHRLARFVSESTSLLTVISLGLAVLTWQLVVVVFGIAPYILPAPGAVLEGIVDNRSLLMEHSVVTLAEIVAAFGLAVLIGVPVALLIAFSRLLERLVYPLLVVSQAIPKIAIAPILITWFGFGFKSNAVVGTLIAFFPVVMNTALGLRSIDPDMVGLARSMGASAYRLFWKVRIPNALPSIFAGLKLAVTFAAIGAIVGEFIAGSAGLGYLIQVAAGGLRTDLAFASITVLSALAVALFYIVEAIERRIVRWHSGAEAAATATAA